MRIPVHLIFRICAWAVFAFSPAAAANYYMAPQGTDNASGAVGAPWKTLGQAQAKMAAGDTLFIRAGTYTGVAVDWAKSGTAAKPMVIKAYPGETPIFKGNGADIFMGSTGQYLVFDGLEITGYTRCAFNPTGGAFLTIRNCDMHHILAQQYGAVTPQYCHHVTIEDNVFEAMGTSLQATLYDHAVYNAAGSHDIVIRGNLFKDNYAGPAINHYHTPSPYNVRIYNNVFVMTAGAERSGIFSGDGAHDIKVWNNTFYADCKGASKCYGVTFNTGNGTNAAVNNIFYFANGSPDDALISPGDFTDSADNNLYYPALDPDDPGTHSLAADPLFLDAAALDFRLASASPAINRGRALDMFEDDRDGNARPIGAGFDIGAYESKDGVTGVLESEARKPSARGAARGFFTGRARMMFVRGNRDDIPFGLIGVDARGSRAPLRP